MPKKILNKIINCTRRKINENKEFVNDTNDTFMIMVASFRNVRNTRHPFVSIHQCRLDF